MILLHSRSGDLGALARRMMVDGFPVGMWIQKPFAQRKRLLRGLVPQFNSWEEAVGSQPQAVVFDMVGAGDLADSLRKGMPIWGGGSLQDAMEKDRGFGMWAMAANGIRIPHTVIFDPKTGVDWRQVRTNGLGGYLDAIHRVRGHIAEAQQFVKATGGKWVLKPYGDAATALTYVASSPEDMDRRLGEAERKQELKDGIPFMLQKFIAGVEISTEVWVQHGVISPCMTNGTLETKKFFPGDMGPNVGCSTSVVWFYLREPIILRKTMGLPQFRAWLRRPIAPDGRVFFPYHGCLDLNTIVAEENREPYGLEWTPRHGYSAIYALCELIEDPLYDVWLRAATGRLNACNISDGYGYAIRVTIPPFPSAEAFDEKKFPEAFATLMQQATDIAILGPAQNPHVWLLDAKLDGGKIVTAGADGIVLEVTGHGLTVEEARDPAHALLEELHIADMVARKIDGADSAIRRLAQLDTMGYDTPQRTGVTMR